MSGLVRCRIRVTSVGSRRAQVRVTSTHAKLRRFRSTFLGDLAGYCCPRKKMDRSRFGRRARRALGMVPANWQPLRAEHPRQDIVVLRSERRDGQTESALLSQVPIFSCRVTLGPFSRAGSGSRKTARRTNGTLAVAALNRLKRSRSRRLPEEARRGCSAHVDHGACPRGPQGRVPGRETTGRPR